MYFSKEELRNHPDVQPALKSKYKPDTSIITPIAKKLGITSVASYWSLFDNIQSLWSENKSIESSEDWVSE